MIDEKTIYMCTPYKWKTIDHPTIATSVRQIEDLPHCFPEPEQLNDKTHLVDPLKVTMLASILTFNETWKFKVHVLQIALIILAIILSIARVTIRSPPASRANTVAITLVTNNLPPSQSIEHPR